MRVIGYSYDADLHCIRHTRERFGANYDNATDSEGNAVHAIFSTDELDGAFHCAECITEELLTRSIKRLRLSKAQQEVINCLGACYSMIQPYDQPIQFEGKMYFQNSIPDTVRCSIPTKDRLLKLNIITFHESGDMKFYQLTEYGKRCVNSKPWSPFSESPAIPEEEV